MNLSTAIIKEEIEQFLSSAYPILTREYFLFTLAMLISCVIFPVLLVRVINQYEKNRILKRAKLPGAYVFRATSKLGLHYTGLFALIIVAVGTVYHSTKLAQNTLVYDKSIIFLSILLMIAAFLAAYYLYKFYIRGLLLAGGFIILYSAYRQYLWCRTARATLDISENYHLISRYGVYAVVHHLTKQSMILSVLTVAMIVFISLYYYRRRYLFTPGRLSMPLCPYCGKAISKGENFCISCGTELKVNPVHQPVNVLDEARYCSKCGKHVNSMGCTNCDGEKALEEYTKGKIKEKRAALIQGTLLTVIVMALLFVPLMINPVGKLQRGTAEINNVYCARWNDFCQNPDIAASPDWLAGFDTEIQALYLADARWYYVQPEIVPYRELVFYSMYAEASFKQMEVLEQMKDFVHERSSENIVDMEDFRVAHTALEDEFNQTISDQARAAQSILYESQTELLWHGVCNGINGYTVRINITYAAIIVLIINACMFIYLLNSFSLTTETAPEHWSLKNGLRIDLMVRKLQTTCHTQSSKSLLYRIILCLRDCSYSVIRFFAELWLLIVRLFSVVCLLFSLFSVKKMKRCFCWMINKLTDPTKTAVQHTRYKEFRHHEWITNAIAIIIAVAIIGIPSLIYMARMNRGEAAPVKEQYLSDASMATIGYSMDILDILMNIRNTKTLTESERERLYELIDKQIEADEIILEYDAAELEDYAEFHAGLCGLCEDDITAVESIRECIERNEIPSQELQSNYVKLRGQNYLWVLETIGGEYVEMFMEKAYDE